VAADGLNCSGGSEGRNFWWRQEGWRLGWVSSGSGGGTEDCLNRLCSVHQKKKKSRRAGTGDSSGSRKQKEYRGLPGTGYVPYIGLQNQKKKKAGGLALEIAVVAGSGVRSVH
jgi:hypothetical protein